jgi:hypothetical protein
LTWRVWLHWPSAKIVSGAFAARIGDKLDLRFNCISNDGHGFDDCAWARVVNANENPLVAFEIGIVYWGDPFFDRGLAFDFVGLTAAPVPAPLALALMGLGALRLWRGRAAPRS